MAKTIAAIATPLAVGGISVIRISGDDAIAVADKVFKSKSEKLLRELKGYSAAYGEVFNGENVIDTSVAVVFRAPKSYTGEDVVEISCHGGVYITREVLRTIIENGAALAEPGEFTKRAFVNGKLSLTQAEAVIDVINSQNNQALKAAQAQLDGALFKSIQQIKNEMLNVAGHLSAWVDFPEEDIPVVEHNSLLNTLDSAKTTVTKLIDTFDIGKIFKEGVETAIVGKPNVGKSTLMNLFAGCQKSIVTDIAGTTRDVVEETISIGDVVLRLSDTAGIRETDDIIEQFGVKKSLDRINTAMLILAVFDNSSNITQEDKVIVENIKDTPAIAVINKTDLESKLDKEYIKQNFKHIVEISAKQSNGIEQLNHEISQLLNIVNVDMSTGMIATERQRACALSARQYIIESIEALNFGMTLDAVTVSIEMAIECLLELTGERVTEEVVNQVFSHFCVGK